MIPTPCPICNAPGGFHEEEVHSKISINPKLTWSSNNKLRRQRREENI